MAGIYPELWLNRVDNKLRTGDAAPWLAGIPEIAAPVEVTNGGSVSEKNTIHIPLSDFDPDILVDYTDAIPAQEYDDDTAEINLNKYNTKKITITDDQAIGSSYAQIDNVTYLLVRNIQIKKYSRAAFNVAPAGDTDNTPVLFATGRSGKFDGEGHEIILKAPDGRLILTYKDIVDHKGQYDDLEVPEDGRRLVLSTMHWNDLLMDTSRIGDLLRDANSGKVAPNIAGFETFQFINNPYYTIANGVAAKKAWNSVPGATDYKASFSFYNMNIGLKTGMTRQYYRPAAIDPDNQGNTLAYRHYYICIPKRTQYIGAIVSPNNG